MSLNPRVCKKSYKVHIPMMGEACEFWLITVTDEQSITNPDKDHAYLTDDGKLFVFNGDSLVRVNCDICFTQEEREKLEGIEEGANKYVLPVASSTELGGVLLGYTQNGRNYPITKDTKGNIYVNVPWEEYQLPKATDNALGGIKTGYKQNGKFYPIKTDTDGNAYVQVPWEDTNTVYEVVSKNSNGLMPMLPSDENASKRFLNGDGEWVVGTDNSINGVTQTGSTFSGETSDCGVQILEVQGKTVQQTTNGYQLFDSSKVETKTSGGATVTNNNDGSFTISGSGNLTETFSNLFNYSKEESLKLLKAGIYKSNVENTTPQIRFGLRNASTMSYVSNKYITSSIKSITLTEEDIQSVEDGTNILSIGFYGSNNNAIVTGTVKPMVYQDGDGTWEPYTGGKPAPNPDYPMPIENVEVSEITSHGKNLVFSSAYSESVNGYLATLKNNSDLKLIYDANNKLTYFLVNNGKTIDDILYPMIEKGEVKTEWDSPTKRSTTSTNLTLAQDDIYQNGIITRARKQVVFDGSSDEAWTINPIWSEDSDYSYYYIRINDIKVNLPSFISNRFKCITDKNVPKPNEEAIFKDSISTSAIYVSILKSRLSSTGDFKEWLKSHSLEFEYELATPTTEEFKVPTIPSYEPYTEISTNSVVDPTITFRPLPFTTCLVGEATEEESGYMPPLSGNSNEFLNGSGEWSVPSGYTLPTASSSTLGGVKIGSNITISDGSISINKTNVTDALGYTPPTTNTTYSVATTSKDGLMSSTDKTKLTNLRRIWKGTSSSPPSGWVDGDIYVQYEE